MTVVAGLVGLPLRMAVYSNTAVGVAAVVAASGQAAAAVESAAALAAVGAP